MDVSLLDMTVLQGVVTHTVPCRPRTTLFLQQKGGNDFGRARILIGFCLMLLYTGSSHLETSMSRVGTDIQQCRASIPRDPGIHHEVPDILQPHSPHHTQGLDAGWLSLLVPTERTDGQESHPGMKLSLLPRETGAASSCSSMQATSSQHQPEGAG